MSKFLPAGAVAKENLMQLVRRTKIEMKHDAAIVGFKELLKSKRTVLPAMLALGFTQKHAVSLEMRLQWQIEQDEQQEKNRLAREAKLAELEAQNANEKAAIPSDNRDSNPLTSAEPTQS
jgi:hypothetical protein